MEEVKRIETRGRKKSPYSKRNWVHFRVNDEEYQAIEKHFGNMSTLRDYIIRVVLEVKAAPGGSSHKQK